MLLRKYIDAPAAQWAPIKTTHPNSNDKIHNGIINYLTSVADLLQIWKYFRHFLTIHCSRSTMRSNPLKIPPLSLGAEITYVCMYVGSKRNSRHYPCGDNLFVIMLLRKYITLTAVLQADQNYTSQLK